MDMENMKLIAFGSIVTVVIMAGCATVEREVKNVTDRVCAMTPAEQTALAEKFDGITEPNRIRVECGE